MERDDSRLATEISNDLYHLRNLQYLRDDPQFIYPEKTRKKAFEEIKGMKPRLLRKIARAKGLQNVDMLVAENGSNLQSRRIEGLDLTELLY